MTPEQLEIARENAQRIVNAGGTDAIDYPVAVGFLSLIAQVEALEERFVIGERPADEQQWAKVGPAVAFHLIERHADNWTDAGDMMEAWANARQAAQVEALTVPQWQPIETAPRDGTLILLGRAEDEENDRGAISTPGRWHDGDDDGPDNMGHDAGFMDDEFQQFAWGRSFGNSAYKNGGFQPTHWMPLPAAPTIPAIPGTKEGA